MDNYKNVPQYLYGLSPSQMDMFMTEDNPARRQSESVTEVSSLYDKSLNDDKSSNLIWNKPKFSGEIATKLTFPLVVKTVLQDSISSANNYLNHGGMWSMSGMDEKGPSKYSMSVSMYRGGARGYGRPRTAPPDLPSLLLDARICYLGMPVRHFISFHWIRGTNFNSVFMFYQNSSFWLGVFLLIWFL